jgi:hypothetical protein
MAVLIESCVGVMRIAIQCVSIVMACTNVGQFPKSLKTCIFNHFASAPSMLALIHSICEYLIASTKPNNLTL